MPITELWCYVQVDMNGHEAICLTRINGQLVPMIGGSLLAMQTYNNAVARLDRLGNPPSLKRFTLNTSREDVSDAAHKQAMALKLQLPSDIARMTDAEAARLLDGPTEHTENELAIFH